MAFAYITEYRRQAVDGLGRLIPAGMEPALAVQKVAVGGVSTQSAAFHPETTMVSINVDVVTSVAFGENPTATTSSSRIAADATQFFGVIPGHRVAVISNT